VRRDRRLIAIWILTASMIPIGVAAGFVKGYPTAAALRAFADQCMSNPTIVAVLGPIFAPTVGGLTAWRTSVSGAMAMGISSILMVIRHTRTEEETGRSELVRSAVIGRHAPLSAALIVVLKCNFAIGAIIALGLMGVGLPASGSIAIGLSWAAAGAVFAAIASATAQLSQSAAACRGIALACSGCSSHSKPRETPAVNCCGSPGSRRWVGCGSCVHSPWNDGGYFYCSRDLPSPLVPGVSHSHRSAI